IDSQRVNLGLHQFDINVLWDLGPHDVSIMLYWLDEEPLWVQCTRACYVQPTLEDDVFLQLGFRPRAISHAHLPWLAPRQLHAIAPVGRRACRVPAGPWAGRRAGPKPTVPPAGIVSQDGRLGEGSVVGEYAILGRAPRGKKDGELELVIGPGAVIRPFTTIYA